MRVNDMVKSGQTTYNPADFVGTVGVSDEWKSRIKSFAETQARSIADFLRGGKRGAEEFYFQETKARTALFKEFKEANGGVWHGIVTNHSLADIQARAALGNTSLKADKYAVAFRGEYLPALQAELDKNGVETCGEEGYRLKNTSGYDMRA